MTEFKAREAFSRDEVSNDLLRSIWEIGVDGMVLTDSEGTVVKINPEFSRTTGYGKEEILGKNIFNLITHRSGEKMEPVYRNFFRNTEKIRKQEIEIIRKDGKNRVFESRMDFITQGGKRKNLLLVLKDITEHKQTLESLLEQESNLRAIFNNTLLLFMMVSQNYKVLSLNRTAKAYYKKILGRDVKPGDNMLELVYPEHLEDFKTNFQRALKGESIQVEKVMPFQGESLYFNFNYEPVVSEKGKVRNVVLSIMDITETKKAGEQLKNLSLRLSIAIKSAQIGIWDYDLNRQTMIWDNGMFDIYGMEEADFVPRYDSWKSLVVPEDWVNLEKEIRSGLEECKEIDTEFRIRKSDGETRHIKAFASVIRDEKGKPQRLVGINYDITAQKQSEMELIAAKEKAEESDRLKSAFLSNMSHEIRTPMTGIIGFADFLCKPDLSDEKRRYFSKIVKDNCYQLLNIVDDIVDVAKIETGKVEVKVEEVNLSDLFMDIYSSYENRAKEREISFYPYKGLSNEASLIYTDEGKLRQILKNLINNAFKFTHEGSIQFGYSLKEDRLEFYVKDTGIGIPPEHQKVIFEHFRQVELGDTRNYGGNGLGLSISKKLVNLMGGRVWVESIPGQGSTFYFTIPYDPVEKEEKREKESGGRQKILIAEDEQVNFIFLEEVLSSNGFDFLHAKNGLEAVDFCRRDPGVGLVLMDIKMPKMNGLEAARKIKAFRPELPIIAQTAYAMQEEKERVLKEGCDDYLAKPLNQGKLLDMIERYMTAKG